jgi:hypothetical protein
VGRKEHSGDGYKAGPADELFVSEYPLERTYKTADILVNQVEQIDESVHLVSPIQFWRPLKKSFKTRRQESSSKSWVAEREDGIIMKADK